MYLERQGEKKKKERGSKEDIVKIRNKSAGRGGRGRTKVMRNKKKASSGLWKSVEEGDRRINEPALKDYGERGLKTTFR